MNILKCGRFSVDLTRPRIMAIINVTPDSFTGDGLDHRTGDALRRCEDAVAAGAHILDIGGESTRPGSDPVSVQEELDRVIPLVERLADWPVPVSVDTVKPEVMRAALAAGASLINDIGGFSAPGAIDAVAGSGAAVCVMHMQGEPRTMQASPHYVNVVSEVLTYLECRVDVMTRRGVAKECILLDPGFGFGKTLGHNLELMRELGSFAATGLPVLVGVSRKSMLGAITGRPVGERMSASISAALLAVERGAHIVRVHDVPETRDALLVWEAVTYGQA